MRKIDTDKLEMDNIMVHDNLLKYQITTVVKLVV